MSSVYDPFGPARRPGGRPTEVPLYRVLVYRRFRGHWDQLVKRVGLQQAQQLWDHLARSPGDKSPIASTTILRGEAGKPWGPGWSRTVHYEASSSVRVDYQYNDRYRTFEEGDPHCVVAILTISFGSH
jgi:hypothetical protein